MMAGLFLLMSGAIALLYGGKKKAAFWLLLALWILCFVMLWWHATDTLGTNW